MMQSRRPALIKAVVEAIEHDHTLGTRQYAGRNLLHFAAGAGCPANAPYRSAGVRLEDPRAEAADAASARPYLDAIDLAVANPDAPGALAVTIAAVDALVYRVAPGFDELPNHASAFRSRRIEE